MAHMLMQDCPPGVGAFGAALLGDEEPAEVEAAFEGAKEGGGGSLVSAKEERDLAALLDLFALGVGDVEEFQERLQAELAALEVRPASCQLYASFCSACAGSSRANSCQVWLRSCAC